MNLCFLFFVLSSVVCAQWAFGQTLPDAGSLRQNIENKDERPEPKKETLLSTPTAKTQTTPNGVTVTIKEFYFSGNTSIKAQVLKDAVAPLLHRPLTFAELETATTLVADTYRKVGWVARAYFPPQDVNSGVVSVTVVESIFGEAHLNGGEPRRIKSKRLVSMVSAQQVKGQLLSADALDSALRRMNELPGIGVTGVLNAGQQVRETDLLLNVIDNPVFVGDVTLDNAGTLFTGKQRISSTIFINSPSGHGEQILTSLLHSDGVDYGQFAATMPVGIGGFRVGPHASNLDYEIVAGLDGVGATGSSTSFGLDTSYPLIRSRFQNLSFLLSLDDSRYENENTISSPSGETSSTSTYKVSSVNMTLNGYVIDGAGGGGVNQAALIFTAGNAKKTDESAEPLLAEGGFKKARYSINRQQHITDWLELHGSLVGQLASGNLTSSEKFTLGGASGVRAYTSTDGTGDLGQLLTLEVRVSLPYHLHVTAFYDMGGVTVDKKPRPSALISTSTPPPNHYTLKGAGLSTSWTSDSGFNLKATWAARIGSNPLLATATGVNDDSSDKNRIWLQASMKF